MEVVSEKGRFAPLGADHPSIGRPCVVCATGFAAGDRVAFVNPSPPGPEDEGKRFYNAEVQLAHEGCVFGEV